MSNSRKNIGKWIYILIIASMNILAVTAIAISDEVNGSNLSSTITEFKIVSNSSIPDDMVLTQAEASLLDLHGAPTRVLSPVEIDTMKGNSSGEKVVPFQSNNTSSNTGQICSNGNSNTSATIVKNLQVPYIHQCWDTTSTFDGRYACGATSAVMILAYWGVISPWPITCDQPYSHTSNYGQYVSAQYTSSTGEVFGDASGEITLDPTGNPAKGAYGYIHYSDKKAKLDRMVSFFNKNGLQASGLMGPSEPDVRAQIDAGYPVPVSTKLTPEGHWVVIKGYTSDGSYIVNDPYGSLPYGTGICGNYNGADVWYKWDQMKVNDKWMVKVSKPLGIPTVTNDGGASSITSNSARLNGEITNTDGENPTVRIYFGPNDGNTNPGSWATYAEGTMGLGLFWADVTGLNSGTKYYYRCYASNSAGSSWASSTATFTTTGSGIYSPTVTNDGAASGIGATVATVGAQITNTGGENPHLYIGWGTVNAGTGSWQHITDLGIKGTGTYYADLSPLTPGTTYYYRAYAINSAGTGWASSTATFTTTGSGIYSPTVTNDGGASSVTSNSARLNGQITNTGGENPDFHIFCGISDGGTNPSSWQNNVEFGILGIGTCYFDFSGLTPGTTYYYRCFAENSAGSSWASSTATFTTKGSGIYSPTVTNDGGASSVTSSSARLNGQITNTGGSNPIVGIYWGLTDGGMNTGSWSHLFDLGIRGLGTFYADISGQTPGTTYYYRCYAENPAGSSWASSTATFTTLTNSNRASVALRAYNGQYLCAEGGGSGAVVANRNAIGAWETFKLIDRGNGNVALQAANGQFVCAEGGGGGAVVANRNAIGAWETFKLIDLAVPVVPAQGALQAANGQYVCAEGSGGGAVVANRNAIGAWETFKLIDRGNGNVALQAANGQYVCAEGGGGGAVVANRNAIDAWETFKLIDRGNGNVALQAANGQFVCAEGGGGGAVVANRNAIGAWETFKLIPR